jgi:hypothetical protein
MGKTLTISHDPGGEKPGPVYHDEDAAYAAQGRCEIELSAGPFPVDGLILITLTGRGSTDGAPGVNAGINAHIDHNGTSRAGDTDFTAQSFAVSYQASCATNVWLPAGRRWHGHARVDPYGAQAQEYVRNLNAQTTLAFVPIG